MRREGLSEIDPIRLKPFFLPHLDLESKALFFETLFFCLINSFSFQYDSFIFISSPDLLLYDYDSIRVLIIGVYFSFSPSSNNSRLERLSRT